VTPPPQPLGGTPAPVISGKVARSAGLVGAATMTSRVLGLVREQVMAYLFGAGDAVDAFNVAFRIPNLIRDLFAEGAMSAAFVPTFTRVLANGGRSAAWRLGNNVVNALLLVTVTVAVLGAFFAHPLVVLLAGQYASVPGKIELTVLLTRLMFPFLITVTLAAASMGMLNALDRYFVPAMAPAVFNVCTIATVLALVPVFLHVGVPTIVAMSCGVLVGGLGQVLLQAPMLRREGYRYRAALDASDRGLREILILMGPGTLGLAATQVNVFVNTWLATSEGTGAVSWLNYAFRLVYLPLGVFGVSIATASIPVIARHAAADDRDGLRQAVASGVSMMLALTIPATLGLMVLARPIVALLFERGRFSPADTAATAAALVCYAVGLAGYSIVRVATPTFYALGDARTPVAVSVAAVVMNVALNLLLVRTYGYRGLALGTSVTALTNAGALLWLLSRRLQGLHGAHLASVATRMLVAATVMAGVAVAVDGLLAASLPGHGIIPKLVRVGGSIGSGIAVLVVMTRALRVTEVSDVALALVSRLAGRPAARP
jgi:putative peptidoglycan lipid II flippase